MYPFETYVNLWRPYIIYGIYIQWFFYIIAAGWVLKNELTKLIVQPKKLKSQEIWVLSVFLGNLIIWAAYFFTNITYYIVGALTFSFLFYLLALLIFFNRKKNLAIFIPEQKYADKKIDRNQAIQLLEQLKNLMETEEPFTNANLKSSDVAKKMQLTVHQLSQLLNDNQGKSFPVYINEFRIAKATNILLSNANLTLEAIGYECGFNSKSTFFTTFKKIMGTTPSRYKTQLLG